MQTELSSKSPSKSGFSKFGGLPGSKVVIQVLSAGGFQAVQMLISAAIGFLIIRNLPKEQYAIFNLLVVGGSTLLGFAGIGILSIVIPFVNQTGASPDTLSSSIAAFKKLDLPVLIIGVIGGILFWSVSAISNGWMNGMFIVGMVLALLASLIQYNYRFPESAYKVVGKPLLPFRISIVSELGRLICVFAIVAVLVPLYPRASPIFLIGSTLAASICALLLIRKRFRDYPIAQLIVTPAHKERYWTLLRPLLFPAYFYHISQFLRGWLIYLLSGVSVIADAAAIGRLMMLFAMMDKAVEMVIIPRLGGIADRTHFLKRLALCFTAVACMSVALLASAWLFPGVWLWLLGAKYSNLGNALLWAVAAAGVERLSGMVLFAQLARGETKNQWWVPVVGTGVYVIYAVGFGLDSAEQATIALFCAAATNLIAQFIILALRIRSENQISA